MGDGSLTQEEIDLLLQGTGDVSPTATGALGTGTGTSSTVSEAGEMSPLERTGVADIVHNALLSGTQGLGLILSRDVKLGKPTVETRSQEEVEREFAANYVIFKQQCSGAINGTLSLFLASDAAIKISAIVMGNDSPDEEITALDSAQIATVKDAIGPMLFAVATQISVKIGSAISPMPLEVDEVKGGTTFPLQEGPSYLKVQIPFIVEGAVDTKVALLLPLTMAHSLFQLTKNQQQDGAVNDNAGAEIVAAPQEPGRLGVKNVTFPSLTSGGPALTQANMNLLMDVQMTLTVELGRTKMYIKEILGLGEGSIIELDKLAGEPVDLLVNGKLIAKGEVVVIDENFGVRVTDIVSPTDRLKQGQV